MQHMYTTAVICILLSLFAPARTDASGELDAALRAMASGDHRRAAALLDDLSTPEARLMRGRALFLAGEHRRAEAVYRRVLQLAPEGSSRHLKARFGLSDCLAARRHFQQAEETFRASLEILTAAERRAAIARRYLQLADEHLEPAGGQGVAERTPEPARAERFYRAALEVGIEGALAEKTCIKIARCLLAQKRHGDAASYLEELLSGHEDTPRRTQAALLAGKAHHLAGRQQKARRWLREAIATGGTSGWAADAAWLVTRTYGMPAPADNLSLLRGQAALKRFVQSFPEDRRVQKARLELATAAMHLGRHDQAEEALRAYIRQGGPDDRLSIVRFQLGLCLAAQGRFASAVEAWKGYLQHHPSHGKWLEARRGIEDMAWRQAEQARRDKRPEDASRLFARFAERYPATDRTPQALFQAADSLLADERELQAGELDEALGYLETLTGKFPGSPWAGEGWFLQGMLLEERRGDIAAARKAYKKAAGMPCAQGGQGRASARLHALDAESLVVESPEVFRTGNKPHLTWHARNLDAVEVRLYRIEAEDFFRDRRRLEDVTGLDIALCTPDRTWKVPVEEYRKHIRITQRVPLPIERAGLYLLHLAAGELETTTAVVVSDLGLVVKSAPGEMLVFAQDLHRIRPLGGVRVLLADEDRVLREARTGRDGVARIELVPDMEISGDLHVFGTRDDHLAWTHPQDLGGQPATGATPRAFLFSGRPAYRPGDEVGLAGFVRNRVLASGALSFDQKGKHRIEVTASNGGVIFSEPVDLDEFGVFSARVQLDTAAPAGHYTFSLIGPNDLRFNGSFQVITARTRPYHLTVEPDRPVVFQGEEITGTIRLRQHHGMPVPHEIVRYRLGSGAWKSATTDTQGTIAFSFPTRGFEQSSRLRLEAVMPVQQILGEANLLVAVQAFDVSLSVGQKTLFTGQPFDLRVRVRDPQGEPIAARLDLRVLRRHPGTGGEVRVAQQDLAVPDDGVLLVPLTLDHAGTHFVRVFGTDRGGHPITAELAVATVGAEAPGLFLDLDRTVQTLGKPATVRLRTRQERALVLLTFETDRILGYRIEEIRKGDNRLQLSMSEDLVPNFTLAACAMRDEFLDTAARQVQVSRRLDLTVRSDRKRYQPGDQVGLTIIARDPDGRPVDARVVLAVVDEALLRQYPERLPELLQAFHLQRPTGMVRTISSNTYRFPEVEAQVVERAEVHETEGSAAMAALRARRKKLTEEGAARFAVMSESVAGGISGGVVGSGYGAGGLGLMGRGRGGGGPAIRMGKAGVMGAAALRSFFGETAVFRPDIRTGKDGVAHLEFALPDSITTWRVTARGVTRDTQLGEMRTSLVSSLPFWAELVTPTELEEGDALQPLVRVHNQENRRLSVRLALAAAGGAPVERTVEVGAMRTIEILFDRVDVPARGQGPLRFELTAQAAGCADRVRKDVAVRPRGVREETWASGALERIATRTLVAEPGLDALALVVKLDARMSHLFFAGRMDPLMFGDRPEEALVALNVLELVGPDAAPSMRAMIQARLHRALVRLVHVRRADGGWGWSRGSRQTSLLVTAAAVRALARVRPVAAQIGWIFPQAIFDQAVSLLEDKLRTLPPGDWMRRAAVLYALAHLGKERVPFVQLHRLHRMRSSIPLGAGALLGHTWLLLGRPEKAAEVVTAIQPRIQLKPYEKRGPVWLLTWGEDPADLAQALALIARVHPADPLVARGADWLLGRSGWGFPRQAEAVSAALVQVLGASRSGVRLRVQVKLNGQEAATVDLQGGRPDATRTIRVDPGLIVPGKNRLELTATGSGRCFFSATLSGYREQAPPASLDAPVKIARRVELLPAPYRGQELVPGFEVVLAGSKHRRNEVERVPAGRRVRVSLTITKKFVQPLDHCVLTDRIPPGFELVEGSVGGNLTHLLRSGRRLALFMAATGSQARLHYDLLAVNPGAYHFPPARLVSLAHPDTRALGGEEAFHIDGPEAPPPEVRPTPDELYQVGKAAAEHDPGLAVERLERLTGEHQLREEIAREVLAILLFASIDMKDNQRIVKYFEMAKEKNPELVVPFDKVRPVQDAYRTLGLHESGLHLDRGLAMARFMAEVRAVGVLESEGEMAEALALLKDLVQAFPDNQLNAEAAYAFSHVVFERADQIREGNQVEGFDRPGLLDEVVGLMGRFLGRFPDHPLAPAAVYSLASAELERGRPAQTTAWCAAGLERHPDSDLAPAITYLKAFAHFKQGAYGPSLRLCQQVTENSQDEASREMALYIMAQIHHARGAMDRALAYYRQVQDRFRDAHEAVQEAGRVLLEAPEVLTVPGRKRLLLELRTRNLDQVDLRAYRIDPMQLYLLKGSMRDLDEVNLAGIRPVLSRTLRPKAPPGALHTQEFPLRLQAPGAYLLVLRGGGRLVHTLVLTDALVADVAEDAGEGRVRVTVRDGRGRTVPGARVQLKGSDNHRFTAGTTDLRGVFIADEIAGTVTVIARHGKSYGLYRGTRDLQAAPPGAKVEYKKKTVYDFDDDAIEGQLDRPNGMYLQQRLDQGNRSLFQQETKGMSVQQAK